MLLKKILTAKHEPDSVQSVLNQLKVVHRTHGLIQRSNLIGWQDVDFYRRLADALSYEQWFDIRKDLRRNRLQEIALGDIVNADFIVQQITKQCKKEHRPMQQLVLEDLAFAIKNNVPKIPIQQIKALALSISEGFGRGGGWKMLNKILHVFVST
jgi:hypothetical protein